MDRSAFSAGAAYVGGQFIPIAQATIPVTDWGITRSDSVYDVVHVYRRHFFRLDDHLARFLNSMTARRLNPPESREQIEAVLHRVTALSGLNNAYVAMVALRGRPRITGSRRLADCDNHLVAYAVPWIDVIPKNIQERGARLWIATTPRVPDTSFDPTVKNYQWGDFTTGLFEASDNDFDTTVLCDAEGHLTEGPGFNVFVVAAGRVSTPDRGSLHGITRKSVIEICHDMAIDVAVVPIKREQLEDADEIFVASTAGGVMPITCVGERILCNGTPGPVTMRLHDAYWKKHDEGWHGTPVLDIERQDANKTS